MGGWIGDKGVREQNFSGRTWLEAGVFDSNHNGHWLAVILDKRFTLSTTLLLISKKVRGRSWCFD